MLHLVYKITNKLNGHYYIGVHSTLNIEDGYMGSGNLIRRAIKKYGIENFSKEILFLFDNRKDAFYKEMELVDSTTLADGMCYNLSFGGGWPIRKPVYSLKEDQELIKWKIPKQEDDLFDNHFEYKIGLINPVTFDLERLGPVVKVICKMIMDNTFFDSINEAFNRKKTNKMAEGCLLKLRRVPAFADNIQITKQQRNNSE